MVSELETGIRVYQDQLRAYRENIEDCQTSINELRDLKKKYEFIVTQSANALRGAEFNLRRGLAELKESNKPGSATNVAGYEKRLRDGRASHEHVAQYIRTMISDTIPSTEAQFEEQLRRNRKREQEILSLIDSTTRKMNCMKEQAYPSQN
ncbi:MAG: hypothetical protein M1836_006442 [Candelina mexicana]|nr:MAG: hypothetical protein M1836_006442 [Candelina mexicana]